ncbi:cupin domain-containing protein [Paraburkholderia acidisoli]|uniref:5-deoxy-glucuronate isomerase n=1 Tax=Paraburkholderia acidisoli TaxID=2571748 RepID=A0A7Z2GPG9_9BURK|nr:hypothetical protein [Paraburkholderia acidisoli]QGZ65552.1 hypothetical protein FAZ98_27805 [Paraburkholderia acidisoli]
MNAETRTRPRKRGIVVPARSRTITRFDTPPQLDSHGNQRWVLRTAHFALAMTRIEGRATIDIRETAESMIVAPAALRVRVRVDTMQQQAPSEGDTLFILPPGESQVDVEGNGLLAHIVGTTSRETLGAALNAADYAAGAPELSECRAWPDPVNGFKLRHYRLDDYVDATQPGRAFRCTNLMVNITDIYPGKRDSKKLKPHSHDDFEQITLTYAGRFAHHLRTPWGPDSTQWQADEHLEIDSPAAISLPAGLIHTSQALEAGCWLVDIFGPPRMDFSQMPGFVRNGDEYPLMEPHEDR